MEKSKTLFFFYSPNACGYVEYTDPPIPAISGLRWSYYICRYIIRSTTMIVRCHINYVQNETSLVSRLRTSGSGPQVENLIWEKKKKEKNLKKIPGFRSQP